LPLPRDYDDALSCEIEGGDDNDGADIARRSATDGNEQRYVLSTYVFGVGVSVWLCMSYVWQACRLQVWRRYKGRGGAQKLGKKQGQTYQSRLSLDGRMVAE